MKSNFLFEQTRWDITASFNVRTPRGSTQTLYRPSNSATVQRSFSNSFLGPLVMRMATRLVMKVSTPT